MEIKIAGWVKLSLIDYPGKMAAVLFLAGCNMRCHYCHNRQIWSVRENQLPLTAVLNELRKRRDWLDGVVVTGGEPTLSPNLVPILQALQSLGFSIKLDTNGTRPDVIRDLVKAGLVDYIALDVKAPVAKYPAITGMSAEPVLKTLRFLREQQRVPYQLRTTLTPRLTADDLVLMGQTLICGAPEWQIQQCRISGAYSDAEIRKMAALVKRYALHIVVTGL